MKDDRCAPARGVFDGQVPAKGVHEAARHGQSEADTGTGVLVAQALKWFEDPLALVGPDPRTPVDDPQFDTFPKGKRLNSNGLPRRRERDGIVNDVGDGALQQGGIGMDARKVLGHLTDDQRRAVTQTGQRLGDHLGKSRQRSSINATRLNRIARMLGNVV